MSIGRIDINEKDLPKICGAIIQLEERADAESSGAAGGSGGGGGAGGFPGGRLTLQTATPVMTTTQSAKTTIYYTPYNNNVIACYDGTNFTATSFSELSNITTNSSTGSAGPAVVAANSVYDLFVWSNGGTLTLTRGPAWTSDTARSAGTVLVMVNGLLLNSVSITNGPAASRGAYVGTVRSNGSSQIDWIIGGSSSGGTAAFFGVWNAYNRKAVSAFIQDSTASWSYTTAVWRAANAGLPANVRCTFVMGLEEDEIRADYRIGLQTTSSGGQVGIGLDATNALATNAASGWSGVSGITTSTSALWTGTLLGAHFLAAIEYGGSGLTFFGKTGFPTEAFFVDLFA